MDVSQSLKFTIRVSKQFARHPTQRVESNFASICLKDRQEAQMLQVSEDENTVLTDSFLNKDVECSYLYGDYDHVKFLDIKCHDVPFCFNLHCRVLRNTAIFKSQNYLNFGVSKHIDHHIPKD